MVDLRTDWTDNIGMQVNAAFLNSLDSAVNANTHAQPMSDTWANRPAAAAGNTGALYFCTDNDVLYKSNGSTWSPIRIGGDSCDALGIVPTSGWTAVNMLTGCTWASDKDAMLLTVASNGSADNWMYQYRSYPTPPFTLTTYLGAGFAADNALPASNTAFLAGIIVSDGTKLISFGPGWSGFSTGGWAGSNWYVYGLQYNNLTTVGAGQLAPYPSMNVLGGAPKWFRYTDNNTNMIFQYSLNGIDWVTYAQFARTTYFTPSRIGISAENFTGVSGRLRVRSWYGVA